MEGAAHVLLSELNPIDARLVSSKNTGTVRKVSQLLGEILVRTPSSTCSDSLNKGCPFRSFLC